MTTISISCRKSKGRRRNTKLDEISNGNNYLNARKEGLVVGSGFNSINVFSSFTGLSRMA